MAVAQAQVVGDAVEQRHPVPRRLVVEHRKFIEVEVELAQEAPGEIPGGQRVPGVDEPPVHHVDDEGSHEQEDRRDGASQRSPRNSAASMARPMTP
jgi:hypothetical protein